MLGLREFTLKTVDFRFLIESGGGGLTTAALALLAYELAGERAGAVLGTALAIKMVAYVSVAPAVGDFAAQLPRRAFLVTLDIVRASVALALSFVDQVWQIYILVALQQSASAAFTPTFQATIPDILTREEDYTRALSLSRLAYDLENLLSPTLAAALLGLFGFHWPFGGTVIGFLASAALVLSVTLPRPSPQAAPQCAAQKFGRGIGIYLATPRLRGLLAVNLAVASAGAMVIVNSVAIVRGLLGFGDADVALAMAAFGGGSMIAALTLPRVLDQAGDRPVMFPAAAALAVLLLAFAIDMNVSGQGRLWSALLVFWLLLGAAYSAAQVPSGRLLRRSAHEQDRAAIHAAHFALSHGCWLITYPLAGWLGETYGVLTTLIVLGSLAGLGTLLAAYICPSGDPQVIAHEHPDLPPDHPHLAEGRRQRRHAYIIDDLQRHWSAPSR